MIHLHSKGSEFPIYKKNQRGQKGSVRQFEEIEYTNFMGNTLKI